jgi:transposase-like protein
MRRRRTRPTPLPQSAFAGFRFPSDVIVLAVRWYLRFGLSYRDVEELLAERGIEVDHVTIYRWVQRFTPLLADAARPCRHAVGDRWQVDETYVKVAGRWRYIYRAIDQFGQVVDVFVSRQRDATAAHQFFQRAIGATKVSPVEVTTDQAPVYPAVLEERLPAAWHRTDRYANNRIECDHGRLKARLRPMRGLKQDRSAMVVIAGHAFDAEHSAWTLRAGCRGAHQQATGGRIRRTGLGDLIPAEVGLQPAWVGATQQRRRRHLAQVLRVYVAHYNAHRPHRALGLEPPNPSANPTVISGDRHRVHRRDRLGGLLHEYHRQAA